MPLPKIEYPILEIYVHSLGKKVKFRPFLVKEEKILLIAKESKDPNEIRNAVVHIINNCILDDTINILGLPLFDIEMIFVKLRAGSVGSSVQLVFNCQNEVDGVPCNTDTDYALDLEKVKYEFPEGHKDTIMLSDKIGMKMRYATMNSDGYGTDNTENDDGLFDVVIGILEDNVEYIFDEESVYKPEDFTEAEFVKFIEGLTVDKLKEIQNFYITSPKVVIEDTTECKKCGFKHVIKNEDLLSFFI